MNISTRISAFVIACLTFFAGQIAADPIVIKLSFDPDIRNGKLIYETCASCHLPEGWGTNDGTYPQIAGQHQNVLIQQLMDIRSGHRENPTMYPFVQERTIGGYQSLADVVIYVSTLPMHPQHEKGPWPKARPEYRKGKKLYENNCASCHGNNAQGNNDISAPRLHGQHYPYLLRQINHIKHKQRKVNAAMQSIVDQLSEEQLHQIINYISFLKVPKNKLAPSINWRNTDYY